MNSTGVESSKLPHVGLVLATSTGAVGAHVASLARHLRGIGHEVTVFGPAATDEQFGFAALGAAFLPVEISASPSPVRDLLAARKLRKHSAGVDLLHAHGMRAGFVAAGARRRPLVTTWHNLQLASGRRGRVLVHLERFLACRVDVALGVSEDLAARLREFGAKDARLLPVGAAPLPPADRTRVEVRAELGCQDRPMLLTVARLHPQKSLDVLINAAALWAKRDPVPLVVIAGDGPQRDELAGLIDRLNAPVRLLGQRDDIADLLAAGDIAVLPSQWEARSFFVQEALRAGLPSVVTDSGGMPAMVADAARVVPVGDVMALTDAVTDLLDDPAAAAQLAAKAVARGKQLPSEAESNAAIAALYAQLLSTAQSWSTTQAQQT
ncbi:MAG: glycosyltransferase family 4 protein [Mycobacteriales bacterium]